jgi:D-alanyl-lipoteichoic acid acyltransferase DltB (MBOAT superfamily)
MVFSSLIFIFGFLPITLIGFLICSKIDVGLSKLFLCVASIVFYGWWEPRWVPVLLMSIVFNYAMAAAIIRRSNSERSSTALLWAAVGLNLLALIYYKYLGAMLGFFSVDTSWASVGLPLGISFFTFTQIAFLVDVSQGFHGRYSPTNYFLFVTFFPHLIAGPIVHHRDLMPQFEEKRNYVFQPRDFATGLAIFSIGLAKKTVLADNLASLSGKMLSENHLHAGAAWVGLIAYSLQLYFDFSGYSDMAIGLARMFGIKFPLNFDSPYKATSIIDFWQRWHITLTRFLTAYTYNPIALALVRRRASAGLSTSKKSSKTVRGFLEMIALPTFITMLLAGVWHGAGMQFLIFGALHGFYISINHAWRTFAPKRETATGSSTELIGKVSCWALVYLCVLIAQLFFRANSVGDAFSLLHDMLGLYTGPTFSELPARREVALFFAAVLIALFAPNTQQIMASFEPILPSGQAFRPSSIRLRLDLKWAVTLGIVLFLGLFSIHDGQPFIYFQF